MAAVTIHVLLVILSLTIAVNAVVPKHEQRTYGRQPSLFVPLAQWGCGLGIVIFIAALVLQALAATFVQQAIIGVLAYGFGCGGVLTFPLVGLILVPLRRRRIREASRALERQEASAKAKEEQKRKTLDAQMRHQAEEATASVDQSISEQLQQGNSALNSDLKERYRKRKEANRE